MPETVNGSATMAEISVSLERIAGNTPSASNSKIESAGLEILKRRFSDDVAKSGKVMGKILFIGKDGQGELFELDGLFLYRHSYTAITHKVIFLLSGDIYTVVSVDGSK